MNITILRILFMLLTCDTVCVNVFEYSSVFSNASLTLWRIYGEFTNAVRHEFVMIANDRQTFVAVRKHSRSFLWCFECYAGLTHQWRMYGEWAYECNSPSIRNDRKLIARHL